MKYVYLALSWLFGVIFLLLGVNLVITSSPLASLCALGAAAFLLPPVRSFVFSKTNKEIPTKARAITVLALLIGSGVISQEYDKEKAAKLEAKEAKERIAQIAQQAKERAEREAKERQENIAFFNSNRELIMEYVKTAFAAKDYLAVVAKSEKYLATNDTELNQVYTAAKTALAEIEKANKEEQATRERAENIEKTIAKDTVDFNQLEKRFKDNQANLKKYYATTEKLEQAGKDLLQLTAIKTIHGEAGQPAEGSALAKKADALLPPLSQQMREMYASILEDTFMKTGINAEVRAIGKQLRIKYALMSKALVYKFQNEAKLEDTAAPHGFTKIVYTDGYDATWTVNL